jgi:hypothetical protein
MLLVCRCFVFVGVCVEFVAAVAWLAELFTEYKTREKVLGYTQAFSSVGGFLVALANGWCVAHALDLPAISLPESLNIFGGSIKDPHAAWRYTLMSGVIPAIPLIIIRPFLPESPVWAQRKAAGTLKRPSIGQLFSPELRKTTIVTTLMFACAYGAAFGAIQHIPRIVPGLPEVKAKVDVAVAAATKDKPPQEQKKLAMLAVHIVSRRTLVRLFQVPGLIIMPVVFAICATTDLQWLYIGIFAAGLLTVAQFSFWGNYLPRAYPLHLRGTGESFAANIGGRLIGTCFAWVTATIATTPDVNYAPTKLAYTAAAIGFAVFLGGFILSFFLPEPKTEDLHE